MGDLISLSIEETNKLRAQLGLALLPVPEKNASSLNVEDTNKLRASLGLRRLEAPAMKKRELPPAKAPEEPTPSSHAPEEGFIYDDVDSASWLEKLGTTPRAQAKRVEREAVEPEAPRLEVKHNAKEMSSLVDGDVLTLEDQGILEDDSEVLANDKLSRSSKLARDLRERDRQQLLKAGSRARFLDEGLDGEESEEEALTVEGTSINIRPKEPKKEAAPPKGHVLQMEALFDDLEPAEPEAPVVSMKRKKKSQSKKRQREEEPEFEAVPMTTTYLDMEDEADDLEAILAEARRKKLSAKKPMSAEDIAREVRLHQRVDAVAAVDQGFVFDDTRDFLDTVGVDAPAEIASPVKAQAGPVQAAESPAPAASAPAATVPEPAETGPEPAESAGTGEGEGADAPAQKPEFGTLSSTLKYLRQNQGAAKRGVDKKTREMQKQAELSRIQIGVEERVLREELQSDARYNKMAAEEQEQLFDTVLSERLASKGVISAPAKRGRYSKYNEPDGLADYSPQVKIQYKDAQGKDMDQKQAWKELSHRYHGSAPKRKKEAAGPKSTSERVMP